MRSCLTVLATLLVASVLSADQISFGSATYSVSEANTTLDVTVTRTSSTGAESVEYATADGTATAGVHYAGTSGTLAFADGESSKTLTLTILDETMYDLDHDFTVTLSNPTAGATLGTAATTVTITNDDDPAPTVSVTGPAEAHVGPTVTNEILYTISLSPASRFPVNVNFVSEYDPDAVLNCTIPPSCANTFTRGTQALTIQPGATSLLASVTAYADAVYKDVTARIHVTPTFGAQPEPTPYLFTHIIDDGGIPTISAPDVRVPEPTTAEGQRVIFVPVSSPRPLCGRLLVQTHAGTAIAGQDFLSIFPTAGNPFSRLNFERDGQLFVQVTIYNNPNAPPERSFTIELQHYSCSEAESSPLRVQAILPPPTTVTIYRESDTPTASVNPEYQRIAIQESGTVTADLGVVATSPQTLAVSTTDPCIQAPASVTISAGQQIAAIPVTAISAPCDAMVNVQIPPPAGAAGTYSVRVHTYNRAAVTFDQDPLILEEGQTKRLVIYATGLEGSGAVFRLSTPSSNIYFLTSSLVSLTPTGDGRYSGTIDVRALTPGPFTIVVNIDAMYGGGTPTLSGEVVSAAPPPSLTVFPVRGTWNGGTLVRIRAADIHGDCWASFGDVPGTGATIFGSDALVLSTPPHDKGFVDVTLRCSGAADRTLTEGFYYFPGSDDGPTMLTVMPNRGTPGQEVTLFGENFNPSYPMSFGGTPASIVSIQPDQEVLTVPARPPGTVTINMDFGAGNIHLGPTFTVLNEPPAITSVTPASARPGDEVTINGTGLAAPGTFAIGGLTATVVQQSAVQAVVRVPQLTPGSYSVELVALGGQVLATGGPLSVLESGVVVLGVTPSCVRSNAAGTSLTIRGSGFAPGATVTVGGTAAGGVQVLNAGLITAILPELTPGPTDVTVRNPDGDHGTASNVLTVRSRFDPAGCGALSHPRIVRP